MKFSKMKIAVAAALGAYLARNGLLLGAVDLSAPEVKEAIKAAVEEATAEEKEKNKKLLKGITSNTDIKEMIDAAVEEATAGLKTKNTELLGEVKKLRKAGGDVDPALVERLEKRVEDLETANSTLTKDLKAANSNLGKTQKSLDGESAFTKKLLIDNGLSDALVKAGVSNATRLKASIAMLRGQVAVVADGDVRKAMVGDKELSAFVTEWAASDEGKEFVTASNNSGGGAHKANTGSLKAEDLKGLPPVERMNRAREDASRKAGAK